MSGPGGCQEQGLSGAEGFWVRVLGLGGVSGVEGFREGLQVRSVFGDNSQDIFVQAIFRVFCGTLSVQFINKPSSCRSLLTSNGSNSSTYIP